MKFIYDPIHSNQIRSPTDHIDSSELQHVFFGMTCNAGLLSRLHRDGIKNFTATFPQHALEHVLLHCRYDWYWRSHLWFINNPFHRDNSKSSTSVDINTKEPCFIQIFEHTDSFRGLLRATSGLQHIPKTAWKKESYFYEGDLKN